jgi:hypothetical protein
MNNMNVLRKILLLMIITGICRIAVAQERLTGLIENPVLMKYLAEKSAITDKSDKSTVVKMPFIDDFSAYYGYPKATLWADSFVFVSDGFARGGLTVGTAVFDAFDAEGKLYDGASSFPFISDYLTSNPIRLDSVFTGTPHIATPADSVYLSFFYQPQGWGDKPETQDSLVVQFFNPVTNDWNTVWSTPGMSYQQFFNTYGVEFKSVMIPVTDPDYFSPDFRFRLYNIASLANNDFPTWVGNVDFWFVDYVYLNSGRNVNDLFPVDAAFRTRIPSLLNDYHSMPWDHFKVNPASNMIAGVEIPYMNYSQTLINLTERLIVTDLSDGTEVYNSGISASNLDPVTDTLFKRTPFPYTFNSPVTENGEFLTQFIINTATIPDMARSNDTLSVYQRFYNYFSYDDGSPESGYALIGANAQLAYRFALSKPDTLRTVMMQFNRVINDLNENMYFNLMVWNDIGGKPGDLIYEQLSQKPVVEGFYGFHHYVLDNPLPVSGTIYVGWKQQDSEAMNIGFDKNTNRNSKIFFNIDGQWLNSMFEGALMIRIVVGGEDEPYVDISESEQENIHIAPNPAAAGEGFRITGVEGRNCDLTIITMDGRIVYQTAYSGGLVQPALPAGIYMVNISSHNPETQSTHKLILTR